jgi:hypothetical protein
MEEVLGLFTQLKEGTQNNYQGVNPFNYKVPKSLKSYEDEENEFRKPIPS